jgi:hypothetical protein
MIRGSQDDPFQVLLKRFIITRVCCSTYAEALCRIKSVSGYATGSTMNDDLDWLTTKSISMVLPFSFYRE